MILNTISRADKATQQKKKGKEGTKRERERERGGTQVEARKAKLKVGSLQARDIRTNQSCSEAATSHKKHSPHSKGFALIWGFEFLA
jgi:hypothetical protein